VNILAYFITVVNTLVFLTLQKFYTIPHHLQATDNIYILHCWSGFRLLEHAIDKQGNGKVTDVHAIKANRGRADTVPFILTLGFRGI